MRAFVLVGLLAACTEKNPDFCASDADCAGTIKPFCDVNGEFTPSNGTSNICTETPDDCPIARCGCTPGEPLACDADQLTACADDGMSTTTSTCALGCSTEDRCLTFEPSNGLGPALAMAAGEPDVVVPAGSIIDTDAGTIRTPGGATVAVRTLEIAQPGAPAIRVLIGRSFVFGATTVVGGSALAVVAAATIHINGSLDAAAVGLARGPGAVTTGGCVGHEARETMNGSFTLSSGGGGAGNATVGGDGAVFLGTKIAGGIGNTGFEPLTGGCAGGRLLDLAGTSTLAGGGGGGGAIQLVAGVEVVLANAGLINVGGGGGADGAGGGSGGTVIMEAPRVAIDGSAAGIVANGASGGGCGGIGIDGGLTSTVAFGPTCAAPPEPGDGGNATAAPTAGAGGCNGSCLLAGRAGGGGGAAGRARFSTREGEIEVVGTPLLSVVTSKTMLVAQ